MNAVEQATFHEEELGLISENMPIALVHEWTAMITAWENDRNSPNPYYMPTKSMWICILDRLLLTFATEASETQVRQRLTLEEEEEQARLGTSGPDRFTRTKFLLYGLDLEHEQFVLFILC